MNKAELINKINHYRYDCDGTEFKNLAGQAIGKFEQYVDYLEEDELIHHSNINCLLYLALLQQVSLTDKVIDKLKSDIVIYKEAIRHTKLEMRSCKKDSADLKIKCDYLLEYQNKLEYAEELLKILEVQANDSEKAVEQLNNFVDYVSSESTIYDFIDGNLIEAINHAIQSIPKADKYDELKKLLNEMEKNI